VVKKKGDTRIRNKRATFDYNIELTFEAGMVLTGAEVKSVRNGKASISEAYCLLTSDGIIIKGMHIAVFENAGYVEQTPLRQRKLLLTKRELSKLRGKMKDKGFTLIPMEIFFSDTGYAKLKIGLGRGRKNYDKRENLKSKEVEREIREAK
jgi:SsrA-binding protein